MESDLIALAEAFLQENGYSFRLSENYFTGKAVRFKEDPDRWMVGSFTVAKKTNGDTVHGISLTANDWRSELPKITFNSLRNYKGEISDDEFQRLKKEREEQQKIAREFEKERQEKTREENLKLWQNAKETSGEEPYLKRKGIRGQTARVHQQEIIIPLYEYTNRGTETFEPGTGERFVGCQRILPDGNKLFAKGQKVQGTFHRLDYLSGTSQKIFGVAEGFATAVTCHELTRIPVYACLYAGNLQAVTEVLRREFPDGQLFIFADNDHKKPNNAGIRYAQAAQKNCGGLIVYPPFLESESGTDWNDFFLLHGKEKAEQEIKRQMQQNTGQKETLVPEPRIWSKLSKMDSEEVELLGKEIMDGLFKVFRDGQSSVLYDIADIKKKELVICHNEDYALSKLMKNIKKLTGQVADTKFVKKTFDHWKTSADSLSKQPPSFTWSDSDEWTFKKLDFTPTEGDFPAWKEFLSRCSSPEDFMAFIWSVFETKSVSRQYLYLNDPNGQGGKTTILNTLGEIFGNAYTAINNTFVSGPAARWLLGNLYGKRLVGWPDVKNTKFCMTEILRNITSGDDVTVEFKGQAPFSTKMYLKLIMASNHEPSISSGGADLSRLIRIDIAENQSNKNDPSWRDKIRQELPFFLYECRKWYEKKCPNHGNIQLDKITIELIDNSTEGIESRLEDIVQRRIQFGEGLKASVTDWMDLCREENLNDNSIGNLKDYLKQHGGLFSRKWVNGKRISTYSGFSILKKSRQSEFQQEKPVGEVQHFLGRMDF